MPKPVASVAPALGAEGNNSRFTRELFVFEMLCGERIRHWPGPLPLLP
jgi:hypothetical protein